MSPFQKIKHRLWKLRHFGLKKPTDLEIALKYCELNPSAKASIITAGIRLQEQEDAARAAEKPHRFTGSAPWAKCIQCGEARENSFRPECSKWTPPANIEEVIRAEEALFYKMIERGRKIVLAINRADLTGEKLAYLHPTHGISPDVAEYILATTLPESLHYAYAEAYEAHEATGAKGQKKAIIVAR